jgi:hypothetical protein
MQLISTANSGLNPHFAVAFVTNAEMPINMGSIADFGTEM